MKKLLWIAIYGSICIQLAGCSGGWAVRTSTSTKPRVDQSVSGNRGFLSGKAASAPKEPDFTERKVYKIEIEIPPFSRKKQSHIRPPRKDTVVWGNKGYFIGGETAKGAATAVEPEVTEPQKTPLAKIKEKISQIFETKPKEPTKTKQTYKVKKRDTLQKISRKFYGTTKKWPLLYKANRDKLKTPDELYPGQVLIIPEAGEPKK
ncbi:MAG: LysM peptidoglycan-binding domain-containing protein [Omnitrophica bacterium]|nr:LysM peptidoglycan-binding domain-containing protein [Candidatus Omnitrophota bacterium]